MARIRFADIAPNVQIGPSNAMRIAVARRHGFDNMIDIDLRRAVKIHRSYAVLFTAIERFIEEQIEGDFVYFSHEKVNSRDPLVRTYCFKDHRDAMNMKIKFG